MGDAAFLLLASKPDIGLAVVALGVMVGSVSGWVVNAIHQDDFLRPTVKSVLADKFCCRSEASDPSSLEKKAINPARGLLEVAHCSCDCGSSIGFISGRYQ